MGKLKWTLILALILGYFGVIGTLAKLTISKECGEVVCQEHTFCSPTDHICRPCESICNPKLGNHDANRCEEDCQDYLHDELYARKAMNSAIQDLQKELKILKILVFVTLGTTTLLLILIAIISFRSLCRARRKHNEKMAQSAVSPSVIYNNKYERSITTPVKKLPDNNNDFRREPSESTLPEYSYDNPSMLPSPEHSNHV